MFRSAPTPHRRQLRAALGFALATALIVGAGFLGRLRQAPPPDAVPALRIVSPATGAVVAAPLIVRFRTPAALRLDPRLGWSAGGLHLHLVLDGVEIMPGAADIAAVGEDAFEWLVRRAGPGDVRLHLAWAGPDHASTGAPTDTIRVRITH